MHPVSLWLIARELARGIALIFVFALLWQVMSGFVSAITASVLVCALVSPFAAVILGSIARRTGDIGWRAIEQSRVWRAMSIAALFGCGSAFMTFGILAL